MQFLRYLVLIFSIVVIISSFITWHFYHLNYAFLFEFLLGAAVFSGAILEFKKRTYSVYFIGISSFCLMFYYGLTFFHTLMISTGLLVLISGYLTWIYGKKIFKK